MTRMRVLFTCRPLTGHYRPMVPLARALADAGHEVAFATGEPVVREAETDGFAVFRAGLGDDARLAFRRRFPAIAALPPAERSIKTE